MSWGANVVLFVTACFLAANMANSIFAAMLTPPAAQELENSGPSSPAAPSWAERQVILDRNLFASSTESVLAPIDPLQDIEQTQLPLDLLGTAAGEDPALSWAAVMDRETRQTLVVSIGDDLKGKATVVRIERRRVVLQENGAPRELTFGDDATPPVRPARVAAARRPPSRSVRLPRTDVQAALANPADILSQARFQPRNEGSELVGIEVNAIKAGSLLEEVGLQNGDLIVEFNGVAINSPEQSGKLLQEFNDARELSLLVEGPDGTTRPINVSLE